MVLGKLAANFRRLGAQIMKTTLIAILLSTLGLFQTAYGQSVAGFGAISGMVRDSSGAVIPNARVTVSNVARGISRSLITNESGIFTAPSLVPAEGYDVVVSVPGFSTYREQEISLEVGKVLFVDAVMQVVGSTVQ